MALFSTLLPGQVSHNKRPVPYHEKGGDSAYRESQWDVETRVFGAFEEVRHGDGEGEEPVGRHDVDLVEAEAE